ncbi:LiaI-LiaF-like domain-containing protein [Bacillus marinisedimentorum]|uniref:LiaI-LiaF-like domain-containing protein n=1 Tax=Bacillus marinisedimentorum TaxID=1821260 RepID=UPI0007E11E78|nr:DUF5668 domain-containing protein [Bacillus marinisedimentorum]
MNGRMLWGFFFIFAGVVFLLDTFDIIRGGWELFWPIFLLVPAIGFHIGFIAAGKKAAGLLVPGGVLLVLSGLFFYHTLFGWESADVTWPFYLFAPAFGLFELYLFGGREPALLIPVTVLTGIGVLFYLDIALSFNGIAAIILILTGLNILFGRRRRQNSKPPADKKVS